jgi:hypothetical protein
MRVILKECSSSARKILIMHSQATLVKLQYDHYSYLKTAKSFCNIETYDNSDKLEIEEIEEDINLNKFNFKNLPNQKKKKRERETPCERKESKGKNPSNDKNPQKKNERMRTRSYSRRLSISLLE